MNDLYRRIEASSLDQPYVGITSTVNNPDQTISGNLNADITTIGRNHSTSVNPRLSTLRASDTSTLSTNPQLWGPSMWQAIHNRTLESPLTKINDVFITDLNGIKLSNREIYCFCELTRKFLSDYVEPSLLRDHGTIESLSNLLLEQLILGTAFIHREPSPACKDYYLKLKPLYHPTLSEIEVLIQTRFFYMEKINRKKLTKIINRLLHILIPDHGTTDCQVVSIYDRKSN